MKAAYKIVDEDNEVVVVDGVPLAGFETEAEATREILRLHGYRVEMYWVDQP